MSGQYEEDDAPINPGEHNPADALHEDLIAAGLEDIQVTQDVIAGHPVNVLDRDAADGHDGRLQEMYEAVGNELYPGTEPVEPAEPFAIATGIKLQEAQDTYQSFVLSCVKATEGHGLLAAAGESFLVGLQLGVAAERLRQEKK